MPPCRTTKPYRRPTTLELEFLRIVTFGHPELECQIRTCEIAEYDVTGWCDVNVLDGPPSPRHMVDGPAINLTQLDDVTFETSEMPNTTFFTSGGIVVELPPGAPMRAPRLYRVEILLWTTSEGMLHAVEVVSYGDGCVIDPYRLFVDMAKSEPNRVQYPSLEHGA